MVGANSDCLVQAACPTRLWQSSSQITHCCSALAAGHTLLAPWLG